MPSGAAPRCPRLAAVPESVASAHCSRALTPERRARHGRRATLASSSRAFRCGTPFALGSVASLPLPEVEPMNALFEPARAGFVVFACLVAACSGATESDGDRKSSSGTTSESGTGAARTPAAPSSGTSSESGAAGTPASSTPGTSTTPTPSADPPAGSGAGTAVCGPNELCHGISSCSNSCYGPTCCEAACQCADIYNASAHLVCQLSCPK